ncbi:hypothetical protein M3J09_012234 [Ascochyta lentis]
MQLGPFLPCHAVNVTGGHSNAPVGVTVAFYMHTDSSLLLTIIVSE